MMRQDLQEAWASRSFVNESPHVSAHADGHAIGMCEAYQKIIDVTANDLTGEDDGTAKQVGAKTSWPSPAD